MGDARVSTPALVAIVGPTAVGKTELSLALARAFDGEIVSADSRQVYRGMDVGTAKPTPAERQNIPHHLLDLVDPGEPFTLAQYQQLAYAAIEDIAARGRVPLLVGGSGLYIRAVLDGLKIPAVAPDLERRTALEQEDAGVLYARLNQLDPLAAERIEPRNKRRVIRALEVYYAAGKPISELQTVRAPDYRVLRIGLTRPRAELYARIDARVDSMVEAGLVQEVSTLMAQGYRLNAPSMSGLGYRQIADYLEGKSTLQEAIRLLKRDTRRFVHHQYGWFRLGDPRIHWFDLSTVDERDASDLVEEFLAANPRE